MELNSVAPEIFETIPQPFRICDLIQCQRNTNQTAITKGSQKATEEPYPCQGKENETKEARSATQIGTSNIDRPWAPRTNVDTEDTNLSSALSQMRVAADNVRVQSNSIGRLSGSNNIITTRDFESEDTITTSTPSPQKPKGPLRRKRKVDTSFTAGNRAHNKRRKENRLPTHPNKKIYGHDDEPKEFINHVIVGVHEMMNLCDSQSLINDDAACVSYESISMKECPNLLVILGQCEQSSQSLAIQECLVHVKLGKAFEEDVENFTRNQRERGVEKRKKALTQAKNKLKCMMDEYGLKGDFEHRYR